MNNKKVSVIIPIYNMEKYLAFCLDTIVTQTLDDVEIICVDDGSTDGTGKILEYYSNAYQNVKVIRQENQGPGPAKNAGIKHAEGEYLAFMDPDDYYPEDTVLEELYNTAKREMVMVCGGSAILEKEGVFLAQDQVDRKGYFFSENKYMLYDEYQVSYGYWRFIYNKQFLTDNDIWFPDYRRFEDPPFLVKTMITAKGFYAIKSPTYVYRVIEKEISYCEESIINTMLQGVIDILEMSQKKGMGKLHGERVPLIKDVLLNYVYNAIYDGNRQLDQLLKQFLDSVDLDLLIKSGYYVDISKILFGEDLFAYMTAMRRKELQLWEKIKQVDSVIIYGAGYAGQCLYKYLCKKQYTGDLEFAVTRIDSKDVVFGKQIREIQDYEQLKKKSLVIVALKGDARFQMVSYAKEQGFSNVEELELDEILLLLRRE